MVNVLHFIGTLIDKFFDSGLPITTVMFIGVIGVGLACRDWDEEHD